MKYHHQKGIIKNDRKGNKKLWAVFFVVFIIISYLGFLFAVLSLRGWPLSDISSSAKAVKTQKPGDNRLYIPAINLVSKGQGIKVSGDPSYTDIIISGPALGFGLTPSSIRQASLFFNIDELQEGDEIFFDDNGVRYVYKVTANVDEEDQKLTIKNDKKTIIAKTVGVIAWNDGNPTLETF